MPILPSWHNALLGFWALPEPIEMSFWWQAWRSILSAHLQPSWFAFGPYGKVSPCCMPLPGSGDWLCPTQCNWSLLPFQPVVKTVINSRLPPISNSFALAQVIRAVFLACDLMLPKSKGWVGNYYLTMYGESSWGNDRGRLVARHKGLAYIWLKCTFSHVLEGNHSHSFLEPSVAWCRFS